MNNDDFGRLFAQADDWLAAVGEEKAAAKARELERAQGDAPFRVALVGGFSRGKTRLFNRLLETDIFTETAAPTTTVLTEVSWGSRPEVWFQSETGREAIAPTAEALAAFSAEGAKADVAGMLRVLWPAPFLENGLFLYDTPGLDDVLAERANTAFKALERCDGALVVISALAPLSLTERAFIETYLYGRAVSNLALVVTFTDQLEEKELSRQFAHITAKAKSLYGGVEIWSARELGAGHDAIAVQGPEAIRLALERWAAAPDRAQARRRRLLAALSRLLEEAIVRQRAYLENLRLEEGEAEKALLRMHDAFNESNDAWLEIRDDFLKKGMETADALEAAVAGLRTELLATLEHDDPEKFAAELRPRLQQAARGLHRESHDRLERDVAEMQEALAARFGVRPLFAFCEPVPVEADIFLELPKKNNLNGVIQVLYEFGRGFLETRARGILPPQAVTALRAAADNLLEGLTGSDGGESRRAIRRALVDFCRRFEGQARPALEIMYQASAERLRAEQQEWARQQKDALRAQRGPEEKKAARRELEERLSQAEVLTQEIKKVSGTAQE